MSTKNKIIRNIVVVLLLALTVGASCLVHISFGRYVYTGIGSVLSSYVQGSVMEIDHFVVKDNKGVYSEGNDLDLTVTLYYKNGRYRTLKSNEYSIQGDYNKNKTGVYSLKVVHSENDGASCYKDITVTYGSVVSLSIKKNKNVYYLGDQFVLENDITVTAVYSDGTARVLTSDQYTVTGTVVDGYTFTDFGEKTGTVSYTFKTGNTVSAEFRVAAVSEEVLDMESPTDAIFGRYFGMFAVNGVPQNYYQKPNGEDMTAVDAKDSTTFYRTFDGGVTVAYKAGIHGGNSYAYSSDGNGGLVFDGYGAITVECIAPPSMELFAYAGYMDNGTPKVPVAAGFYVDTIDTLQYEGLSDYGWLRPGNSDIDASTGVPGSNIYAIRPNFASMNLSAGTHTVYFVAIFADGMQELTHWTLIINKEELDLSNKTANIIVLAGQSNAYGVSDLTNDILDTASMPDYSKIFINYCNINIDSNDSKWKPLYANAGFEQYAPGVGGTLDGRCFGPEVGIAYYLATQDATKDEVWYIIKYTAAGTFLDGQWVSGTDNNTKGTLINDMGSELSTLMIKYIDDALADIAAIHGTNNINFHSFMWMQGESDASYQPSSLKYQANEAALASAIRTKYASYAKNDNGDNIVFVSGAIAGQETSNNWAYADTVNKAKVQNTAVWWVPETPPISNLLSRYPELMQSTNNPANNPLSPSVYNNTNSPTLKNSAWVDTAALSVRSFDTAHYDRYSMFKLGQWFGTAAIYLHSLIP